MQEIMSELEYSIFREISFKAKKIENEMCPPNLTLNQVREKKSNKSVGLLILKKCLFICGQKCATKFFKRVLRGFDTFDCHKVVFTTLTAMTVVFSITQ